MDMSGADPSRLCAGKAAMAFWSRENVGFVDALELSSVTSNLKKFFFHLECFDVHAIWNSAILQRHDPHA